MNERTNGRAISGPFAFAIMFDQGFACQFGSASSEFRLNQHRVIEITIII